MMQRNGPFYQVPTGRRDGRVSDISHAANIPEVGDSIQLLKSKFRQKGLSDRALVLLSGILCSPLPQNEFFVTIFVFCFFCFFPSFSAAHTIGTTACFFIETRLYNFTQGGGSDPAINPDFLPKLKAKCPFRGDINVRLPLDPVTEETFDVQILRNIRDGLAVIESDAKLYDDRATKRVVDSYIGQRGSSAFGQDFAEAMVKMGNIGVKTGSQGEIRRICTAVNGVPL